MEQLSVPGTDEVKKADQERIFKEMIANNPRPITFDLAERFVRNMEREKGSTTAVVSTIKQVRGFDLLRVVLKTRNGTEDEVKFEQKTQLPIDNREEYELKYTELVEEVYQQWLRCEKPKFS